ncbi:MAG: hypothetical protein Q9183_004463, partial [Haloplaca sp. 2 TL-2023]
LKDTKATEGTRYINILCHGEESVWASVLQRMDILVGRRYTSRTGVIAGIIQAMTGERLDPKQVGRHLKALQKLQRTSPMSKSGSSIVKSIVSVLDKAPYTLHNNIYNLLRSVPLKIVETDAEGVNSINTLDLLIRSLSPAFRQAIQCIHVRYKSKQIDLTKFLDTFQYENLPGLRELYTQRGEQGQMLRAPPICTMSAMEHRDMHVSAD